MTIRRAVLFGPDNLGDAFNEIGLEVLRFRTSAPVSLAIEDATTGINHPSQVLCVIVDDGTDAVATLLASLIEAGLAATVVSANPAKWPRAVGAPVTVNQIFGLIGIPPHPNGNSSIDLPIAGGEATPPARDVKVRVPAWVTPPAGTTTRPTADTAEPEVIAPAVPPWMATTTNGDDATELDTTDLIGDVAPDMTPVWIDPLQSPDSDKVPSDLIAGQPGWGVPAPDSEPLALDDPAPRAEVPALATAPTVKPMDEDPPPWAAVPASAPVPAPPVELPTEDRPPWMNAPAPIAEVPSPPNVDDTPPWARTPAPEMKPPVENPTPWPSAPAQAPVVEDPPPWAAVPASAPAPAPPVELPIEGRPPWESMSAPVPAPTAPVDPPPWMNAPAPIPNVDDTPPWAGTPAPVPAPAPEAEGPPAWATAPPPIVEPMAADIPPWANVPAPASTPTVEDAPPWADTPPPVPAPVDEGPPAWATAPPPMVEPTVDDIPPWAGASGPAPAAAPFVPDGGFTGLPEVSPWSMPQPSPVVLPHTATPMTPAGGPVGQVDPPVQSPVRQGRKIIVTSAKGGAGATVVAAWMAYALASGLAAQQGVTTTVPLVDADLMKADMSKMLGLWGHAPDVYAAPQLDERTVPSHLCPVPMIPGVQLLAGPNRPRVDQSASACLSTVLRLVRRHHPWTIVAGPSLAACDAELRETLLLDADLLIVVVSPNMLAISDTADALAMLCAPVSQGGAGYTAERVSIVLNHSNPADDLETDRVASLLRGWRLIGDVPIAGGFMAALDQGHFTIPDEVKGPIAQLVTTITSVPVPLAVPAGQTADTNRGMRWPRRRS